MKHCMRVWALMAGLMGCVVAQAAVTVSDVKVQQRWPWNGLVDIDYTLTCDTPDADIYVYPTALDGDRMIQMSPRTLTGDGANGPVKAGTHRMTWDMATDQPDLHSSDFTVKIHAFTGAAPYMIVDLSSGPDSTHYPVEYSNTCPDLTDDTYKTTKMVFKLILPGTFMMGSPTTESGRTTNEDLHQVTLTQPFYMAIYECTRQQWYQVTGVWETQIKNDRVDGPVQYVSWNEIRGTAAALTWPTTDQVDNDSFMGKLRMRTGLTFDLPTEAQWEYACRAGTSSRWSWGETVSTNNARYGVSSYYNGPVAVAKYAPNPWGLYDMHGNLWEWCVDAWTARLGTNAVVDPKGGTGDSRVVRGGCMEGDALQIRSAFRTYSTRSVQDGNWGTLGFRAICRPMAE